MTELAYASTICILLALISCVLASHAKHKQSSQKIEVAMWVCVGLSVLSLLAHGVMIDESRGLVDAFMAVVP